MLRKSPIFIFILILSFSLSACSSEKTQSYSMSDIQGKFVFDRADEDPMLGNTTIYVPKEGILKKLDYLGSFPVWSPDGKKIAISRMEEKAIYILDEEGSLEEKIQSDYYPSSVTWLPDGKKLLYVGGEKTIRKIADTYRIISYDFGSDAHTELKVFDLDHKVYDLNISSDSKKLIFEVGSSYNRSVSRFAYLMMMDYPDNLKKLHPIGTPLGWFPDDEHALLHTNTMPDGSWIDAPYGVLAKFNIKTLDFKILYRPEFFYQNPKLSKDGKYVYYARGVKGGGKAIFVWSLETDEEAQVTTPKLVNGRYTRDTYPSWSQS